MRWIRRAPTRWFLRLKQFDKNPEAAVAVLWGEGGAFCAGWDLKYCASLIQDPGELHSIDYPLDDRKAIPRGPAGADAPRARQAGDRRGRRAGGRRRLRARAVVRRARDGAVRVLRRLLPALGRAADRRRHGAPAAHRRHGPRAGDHPHRAQGAGRGGAAHRRCEHVVPDGKSREFAEAMAHEIARFPQACVRADRRSAYAQQGLQPARGDAQGVVQRLPRFRAEGAAGAARFASGKGRHGDFGDI